MVLQPFEKEIDFFEKINFNLILKYFLEVLYWLSYGSWYQRGHYHHHHLREGAKNTLRGGVLITPRPSAANVYSPHFFLHLSILPPFFPSLKYTPPTFSFA